MQHEITTAQAFRTARIKAGLSVRELAERAGVNEQQLYKIEKGIHSRPQMRTVRAVAQAVGVSPADLLPEEVAA